MRKCAKIKNGVGFGGSLALWSLSDDFNKCYVESRPDKSGRVKGGNVVKTIRGNFGVPICFFTEREDINGIKTEMCIAADEVTLYEPWDYNSPSSVHDGYSVFELMDEKTLKRFIDGGYYYDQETGKIRTDDPEQEEFFEF